ncbi:MAG: lysophospholipid acyltransferase family protein [Woeseia sp.]
MLQRSTGILYGVLALAAFAVLASFALLFATVVPGLSRRRRWVSAVARSWFAVAGIPVERSNFGNIPHGHCIVVANHASYFDGVILQAYLPPRFSFVIKGEMQNVPFVHFLLRRIGSKFVERFVASRSSRDARNLLKAAAAGESLAVFPEGTFGPEPGLGKFRAGAFAAAIKGNIAVVPVAIGGSRHLLPSGHLLPRRKRLTICALPAIEPGSPAFDSSKALAERSRQVLLAVLDEPDLAEPVRQADCAGGSTVPGLQNDKQCE